MVFLSLNNGRTINLLHISSIYVADKDVVFEQARGSLTDIREHFDTVENAVNRYEELKQSLVIAGDVNV